MANGFANAPTSCRGVRKHLVVGNHDRTKNLRLPWDAVTQFLEVRDDPKCLPNTLCHYPIVTWNHSTRGALQLFGHVHHNWKGTRNSVNVGVDALDCKPVQLEDIQRREKTFPVIVHWPTWSQGWIRMPESMSMRPATCRDD